MTSTDHMPRLIGKDMKNRISSLKYKLEHKLGGWVTSKMTMI